MFRKRLIFGKKYDKIELLVTDGQRAESPGKENAAVYPYELFWGLDLYTILMAVGFLAGLIMFRVLADRIKMPAKVQNLCIVSALAALVGGYFAAVFTQAIYNAIESGRFVISEDTGATFYGGLLGGIAVFLGVYAVGGRLWDPESQARKQLPKVFNTGICGVALGHGIGRIGCLCAGCCHGHETEAWYGIMNVDLGVKTVPLQLYEALFLFALCVFLVAREVRGKQRNFSFYLLLYGTWRFCIEFFRADDRGKTIVPFLTPSQLVALVLIAVGAVQIVRAVVKRTGEKHE